MLTKLRYFDAHTHVNLAAYEGDYKEVVHRALESGVGMINVGTMKSTSRRAVELAHEFENGSVYAAVGLHPIHTGPSFHDEQELGPSANSPSRELAKRGEVFDLEHYKKLALDAKVVAIGECGLDYAAFGFDDHTRPQQKGASVESAKSGERRLSEEEIALRKKEQREAFIAQMELAHEVGKPLMIHCREAYADLLHILNANSAMLNTGNPGIVHFFAGTADEAEQFLDLGFSFTFGGAITFPPKKTASVRPGARGVGDYAAIVRMLPNERILSETDAPYVAPVPYRGKRNEPAYVIEVVKKLADIKQIPFEAMRLQILENTERIFNLPVENLSA